MEKETLFIAFSTQKGGVGKTAFTVLMSSYLHYVQGLKVAIIDCDYPQHSIFEMRQRDMEQVMKDNYYKQMAYQQFTSLKRKAYSVVSSRPENAISKAEEIIEQAQIQPNIIFFDLPGTLNSKGVVKTLGGMDYIFAPVSADRVVLESTLKFASLLNENLVSVGKGNIKGLHLIWNMVDGREKNELYQVYEDIIGELGLNILKTFVPDTKRFRRELTTKHKPVFRSTLFPAHKSLLKGSNIDVLAKEILETIKLQ
ncbi:Cellulose biosynthesis protein BcsQ [Mariniphaga anaerophila]|uniref:Cellulose biosynthesis protein BcsQ n=1 Tax=Mariniphaga anaerophila TaxID=1484053 RepID=A0A1M4U2B6_9BACT|nr:ParA family protein [Mariniphaga anaerophila]SHE50770.1 Cellulose biosynthesis protein BcsQ [Mariniphaga anaerophila]